MLGEGLNNSHHCADDRAGGVVEQLVQLFSIVLGSSENGRVAMAAFREAWAGKGGWRLARDMFERCRGELGSR
jgi:hypothetical protein